MGKQRLAKPDWKGMLYHTGSPEFSKAVGEMKKRIRDMVLEWEKVYYTAEAAAERAKVGKKTMEGSNVSRAMRTLMLSPDHVWGPVMEEFLTKGTINIENLFAAVKTRQQTLTDKKLAIIPTDTGHHGTNLQSFDAAWTGDNIDHLQEFLGTLSEEQGGSFGDDVLNLRGNLYDPRAHQVKGKAKAPGEIGLKEVTAHPRGTLDTENRLPDRVYGSAEEMIDAGRPVVQVNKGDLLLADYAAQSARTPVDDWLQKAGILQPGQSAWDADITQATHEQVQKAIKENPALVALSHSSFRTPDPSLNGIQSLKRWAKLAYDNPYVKLGATGVASILGPLGAIADTGDTVEGVKEGNFIKAAAGTTGLASIWNPVAAIPAAVFGLTDLASERRQKQIDTKDFDEDYDKLTPGVASHTEETPVTITPTRPPDPSKRGFNLLETLGRMNGLGSLF